MDSNISPIFQPLYEHLQAILGECIPNFRSLFVPVAKVVCSMILLDAAPAEKPSIRCGDLGLQRRRLLGSLLTCPTSSELPDVEDLSVTHVRSIAAPSERLA